MDYHYCGHLYKKTVAHIQRGEDRRATPEVCWWVPLRRADLLYIPTYVYLPISARLGCHPNQTDGGSRYLLGF